MRRLITILILAVLLCSPVFGRQIGAGDAVTRLGSFTGPVGGTAQDDNVKASLDLAHTDLDTGLADNEDLRSLLNLGTGNIFYVDSAIAGSAGTSRATAVGTIDAAVNLCTTDNGDNIIVCEGHSEALTAADGVDVDKADITIVGLGNGEHRPLLDFTNANGEFVIGSDDITVRNLQFKANVTDVTTAINVETGSENWIIEDCRFYVETTGTDEFTDTITTTANSDNGKIINCRFEMGAGGADAAIQNVGCDYVEITGNIISGDYATACIEDKTTASIWMIIDDNILINGTVGGVAGLNAVACISLKADTAAVITDNKIFCNVAAPELAIVAADAVASGNTYSEYENASGSVPVGKDYALDALAVLGIANTGSVFYCDSGETSGLEDGRSWGTATDTLDEAINLCTANAGDVIFVAPGHTETFTAADGFDVDVAGVTIIGLGSKEAMPTFVMNNANAEVAVSGTGDNVTIKNLRFECSVTGVLRCIDIEAGADGVTIDGCLFWEVGDATGTDEFVDCVYIGNACIDTTIQNCTFRAEAAGAVSAITTDDDTSFTTIKNNVIVGDYSTACIEFATVASTDLHIIGNTLVNGDLVADGGLNAVAAISIVDGSGGLIADNKIASDVATGLLMRVADDMTFINNWITDTDGDEFSGTTEDSAASIAGHTDG